MRKKMRQNCPDYTQSTVISWRYGIYHIRPGEGPSAWRFRAATSDGADGSSTTLESWRFAVVGGSSISFYGNAARGKG